MLAYAFLVIGSEQSGAAYNLSARTPALPAAYCRPCSLQEKMRRITEGTWSPTDLK